MCIRDRHQGEVTAGSRGGPREGVTHNAFDAESGVDADLGRNLVRGADTHTAAIADIGAFGALAHHDEICLLYTSDAAHERSSVDLGGPRIIKKKKKKTPTTDR